jgi:hypothetical protein
MLVLAATLCGCSHRQEEEALLREAIARYTRLLPEGYVTFDMSGVQAVITPNQAARLDHRLGGLKLADRRMESKLKQIEYLAVALETDKTTGQKRATIKTREVWDTRQVDQATGATVRETHGLTYLLDYRFLQIDDRWLIDDVVVLEDKAPAR